MTAVLVYGRPLLVFGGMVCALAVIWQRNPVVYSLGVILLLVSMTFDLIDGWFAARYRPQALLASLADRLMDKLVFSTIFPVIAVGIMWRLIGSEPSRPHLLHAIFVLMLCVTVLIRDNFAGFMRSFALRQGNEPESFEFNRLRTVIAAPVSALLYAYAFHVPGGPATWWYQGISRLATMPLNSLFFIEIIFLVINFGSIAGYCRKYGSLCLDELCLGDEVLRRKILSVLPNALTVMNALMGLIGVFFAYQGRFREMLFMVLGAATFDKLDGALARRLGLTEPLPEHKAPKKSIWATSWMILPMPSVFALHRHGYSISLCAIWAAVAFQRQALDGLPLPMPWQDWPDWSILPWTSTRSRVFSKGCRHLPRHCSFYHRS